MLTNVTPAIPVPELGILLPVFKILVFLRQHNVAESERYDLDLGVPSCVLLCDRLSYELRQRICRLWLSFVLFCDWKGRGWVWGEGNANQGLG